MVLEPMAAARRVSQLVGSIVSATAVLSRSGLLTPVRPDVALRAAGAMLRFGISPATAYEIGAARYPRATALADEEIELSFSKAARAAAAEAERLRLAGIRAGRKVAILSRNHTGFALTLAALSALRADVVLLNAASSPAETAAVLADQDVVAVVHESSLEPSLAEAPADVMRLPIWHPGMLQDPSPRRALLAPGRGLRQSRFILLSSGTTGTAKGSSRGVPHSIDPLVAFLSRIPLRARDTTYIASPLFHAWGFGNFGIGLAMSATIVLQDRFDAEETLAVIERHRVRVLVAVPTMLQRLVELPAARRELYDHSSLEVVVSSGSALPTGLAPRFMDCFGDVLYNLYGSTEAAWAAIATPAELREDPSVAGRPPQGTSVKIVDDSGAELPVGKIGRIAVRNSMSLTLPGLPGLRPGSPVGYVITGDLGHFTGDGLLHVDGREDDMIVSGGENVYPKEVEDALGSHPLVREVAVVGVEDENFGQRLRAFVVLAQDGAHCGAQDEQVTARDLKEHVGTRLARFKIPKDIVFVERLPHNAAGKTLHRELRRGPPQSPSAGGTS